MEFCASVVEMLGASRVRSIEERLSAIRAFVAGVPDQTAWVKHMPIPLASADPVRANEELAAVLHKSGPHWFFVTGVTSDGHRFGYASDVFRPQLPHVISVAQFLLFDIHTSLGGWYLSHLWRAAEFAETTCESLAEWRVLSGAACARALLEGIAAFVMEGEQLLTEWSLFKERGVPDLAAVSAFRDSFNAKLLQAQFGSRLGERAIKREAPLKRTNVLTLMEKFSKRAGRDVLGLYEWLCDAVHPSFGFHTAYVATQGVHQTGATFAADLARRPDRCLTRIPKIEPTVAWACADVLIIAVDALLDAAPRLRWFTDDFGLTTGVATAPVAEFPGGNLETAVPARCPCGSGLKFAECRHAWGTTAEPPVASRDKH
jgi:hypothetical protein